MIAKTHLKSPFWVTIVTTGLLTLLALNIYTINNFDYGVFHDAAEAVLEGKSPYSINDYYENETEEGTGYYNPPHTIFYVAPFAFWGAPFLAFVNISIVVILLVGFDRSLQTMILVVLGILLSPQIIFLAAAVNIPGITTGLGLLLLFTNVRGVARGFAWTLLSGRPQDAGLVLLYDMWTAFRAHDWYAFLSCTVLVLPSWLLLSHWLAELPDSTPTGNTLSPSVKIGVLPTVLFLGLIGALRLMTITPEMQLRRRRLCAISETERCWILIIVLQVIQPYLVFYMLWAHLLPLRVISGKRIVLLLSVNLLAFVTLGRSFSDDKTVWVVLLIILVVTLLIPRFELNSETIP